MKRKSQYRRRRSVRGWAHSKVSAGMSMGARIERLLYVRLVELERRLDSPTDDLWDAYVRTADAWLRARAPVPSTPPITKAQLNERYAKR